MILMSIRTVLGGFILPQRLHKRLNLAPDQERTTPSDIADIRGGGDVGKSSGPGHTPRHLGRHVALVLALALSVGCAALAPAMAEPAAAPDVQTTQQVGQQDHGPKADVQAVKEALRQQVGDPGNVSVSHDWALGRASTPHVGLSVLLHRVDGQWKVQASDGGVYLPHQLETQGVPHADAQNLVQLYR